MADIVKIKYQRSFQNEAMIGSDTKRLPIDESAINQHNFFNELIIVNTSSSDLRIIADDNTDKAFLVPAKGSWIWAFKDDNFKFTNITYTEVNGNAVSAGAVYFSVLKKRYELGVE